MVKPPEPVTSRSAPPGAPAEPVTSPLAQVDALYAKLAALAPHDPIRRALTERDLEGFIAWLEAHGGGRALLALWTPPVVKAAAARFQANLEGAKLWLELRAKRLGEARALLGEGETAYECYAFEGSPRRELHVLWRQDAPERIVAAELVHFCDAAGNVRVEAPPLSFITPESLDKLRRV